MYKDNVEKEKCWDAVGITRFLNIAYAMFMHHVGVMWKRKAHMAERLVDRCGEMLVRCEQLLLNRSRSWRCVARPGASQPMCPRRLWKKHIIFMKRKRFSFLLHHPSATQFWVQTHQLRNTALNRYSHSTLSKVFCPSNESTISCFVALDGAEIIFNRRLMFDDSWRPLMVLRDFWGKKDFQSPRQKFLLVF